MRRVLAILVFALAAGTTLLASTGVSAPPHRVAAGTPLHHTLVLGAYRFAFLIEPIRETRRVSPAMAALHKVLALEGLPMTDMPGMESTSDADTQGPIFKTGGLSPAQDLLVVLGLLALLWPRLPRPTLLALAELAPGRIARALWRTPLILGPPRFALP